MQSVPVVREIVPLWPILLLLVTLLGICALALIIMTTVVLRPRVSQTLRVDED